MAFEEWHPTVNLRDVQRSSLLIADALARYKIGAFPHQETEVYDGIRSKNARTKSEFLSDSESESVSGSDDSESASDRDESRDMLHYMYSAVGLRGPHS